MLLSPQSVLALAAASALASVGLSIRANRLRARRIAEREAWPALVESLVSSIAAGLSRVEAMEVAVARSPRQLHASLKSFSAALQNKRLTDALPELRDSFENSHVDEFVRLVSLNEKFGGTGLVGVLKAHAKTCRERNTADSQVRAKNSASLTVAKLGVAAPWVLLALLLSRSESASSFETTEGISILLGGLAVCIVAYRLIVLLGRPREEVRVYGSKA